MGIVFNMLISHYFLSLSLFFFFFWLHCVTCGILGPQTGIEPEPLGLPRKSQNLFTLEIYDKKKKSATKVYFLCSIASK